MRYLFAVLSGFLVGCVLTLTALYYNPLTADSGVIDGVSARVFNYRSPFSEGLAVSHSGLSRLPLRPDSVPELWENTISRSLLSVTVLEDEDAVPTGIASRVSQFSETTEMLTNGLVVEDEWLITIPNEGSFFLRADSNLWPFFRETLIPVWYLDRPWDGPRSYRPTSGPGEDGSAMIADGTGAFENVQGSAVEHYEISAFDSVQGPAELNARLYLKLPRSSTGITVDE